MAINSGDFVKLNFTGKIKENDEVFDTTYEDVAKEAEIYDEKRDYSPVEIVVGANHLLPAIEEEVEGLEVGDKKTIEVLSENAFGARNSDLVRLIPMKDFKKQGLKPFPGMPVNYEGMNGKVISVNSGRVRVDFNHPFAGKDLVYDVEVLGIIEDDEDKIKSMIKLYYVSSLLDIDATDIEIDGNTVNIQFDDITKFDSKPYSEITIMRYNIANAIMENMDITDVNFIDNFPKREEVEEE